MNVLTGFIAAGKWYLHLKVQEWLHSKPPLLQDLADDWMLLKLTHLAAAGDKSRFLISTATFIPAIIADLSLVKNRCLRTIRY